MAGTMAVAELIQAKAKFLRLLGDPTRLLILCLLKDGEIHVAALCEAVNLAQPTVSHHLGLLRGAEVVVSRRVGKQVFYKMNPEIVEHGSNGVLRISSGGVTISCNVPGGAPELTLEDRSGNHSASG